MCWKGTMKVYLWNELMIESQRWTEQSKRMISLVRLGLAGILTTNLFLLVYCLKHASAASIISLLYLWTQIEL